MTEREEERREQLAEPEAAASLFARLQQTSVGQLPGIRQYLYTLEVAGKVGESAAREPFPMVLSGLAVVVGIWPGIWEAITRGRLGDFDPGLMALYLTIIALIWTAHFTYLGVQHAKSDAVAKGHLRDLERSVLIAGLLAELHHITTTVEVIGSGIFQSGDQLLNHQQLRLAQRRLDLLNPDVSYLLSSVGTMLDFVSGMSRDWQRSTPHARSGVDEARADPDHADSIGSIQREIKRLVAALKELGGYPSDANSVEANDGERPQ
jgi:hypothetical protein